MDDELELGRPQRAYKTVTDNQGHIERRIALDEAVRNSPGFTFSRRVDGATPDRCPNPHEINEGSASVTAIGDTRHQYLCLDCRQKWEGGPVQLPFPR